jgi:fructokinase
MEAVFGGVEGGGTKFVCMVGTGPDRVVDETRFPTTTPDETLGRIVEFFRRPRTGIRLAAVGAASFGRIDLDRASPTYGYITTTPKPHWANTDVVGTLHDALGVPIGWDTDTNGAALGEHRWGAGVDADPLVYMTVGTGIGGGAIVNGHPLHGLLHPEMGHLLVPTFDGDTFSGVCPFHGRCLEGVASGPALQARTGRAAQELPPDDPVWDLEAQYLAFGLLCISEVISPQRIVMGGGVAGQAGLIGAVRRHLVRLNAGYIIRPALVEEEGCAFYLVPPGLGSKAGVMGALELARLELEREEDERCPA